MSSRQGYTVDWDAPSRSNPGPARAARRAVAPPRGVREERFLTQAYDGSPWLGIAWIDVPKSWRLSVQPHLGESFVEWGQTAGDGLWEHRGFNEMMIPRDVLLEPTLVLTDAQLREMGIATRQVFAQMHARLRLLAHRGLAKTPSARRGGFRSVTVR